jgi:hypothetical protein
MIYPILARASVTIATIAFPADDGARESVTDPMRITIISGMITDFCTW